jgi:xanthine dehydrogenase/oxidase
MNISIESLKNTLVKCSTRLDFYVNNDYKSLDNVDPKTTLLRYLRDNGYLGTKYGCGEGGCGACCVVVAEFNSATNQVRYRTANSCLMPLCAVFGKQIITVEGIGCPNNPHPIQVRYLWLNNFYLKCLLIELFLRSDLQKETLHSADFVHLDL